MRVAGRHRTVGTTVRIMVQTGSVRQAVTAAIADSGLTKMRERRAHRLQVVRDPVVERVIPRDEVVQPENELGLCLRKCSVKLFSENDFRQRTPDFFGLFWEHISSRDRYYSYRYSTRFESDEILYLSGVISIFVA